MKLLQRLQIDASPLAQPWRTLACTPADAENLVISTAGDTLIVRSGQPPSALHCISRHLARILLGLWRLSVDAIPLATLALLFPQYLGYLAILAFGIVWFAFVPAVVAFFKRRVVVIRELEIAPDRWHLKTRRAHGISKADKETLEQMSGLTSCLLGAKACFYLVCSDGCIFLGGLFLFRGLLSFF
jgi:hypothetical protein